MLLTVCQPIDQSKHKAISVQVDGKSSVACYLMALDKCYASLCEKFERCRSNFERQRRLARSSSSSSRGAPGAECCLHVLPRRNVVGIFELWEIFRAATGQRTHEPSFAQNSACCCCHQMAFSLQSLLAWHAILKEQSGTGSQQYCIPGWSLTSSFEEHIWFAAGNAPTSPPSLTLADVDYCVMHSPFVKMVRKGFARIFYQDHLRADIRQTARQVMLGRACIVTSCHNWGTLCSDNEHAYACGQCYGNAFAWSHAQTQELLQQKKHCQQLRYACGYWHASPWSIGCECICLGDLLRQTGQLVSLICSMLDFVLWAMTASPLRNTLSAAAIVSIRYCRRLLPPAGIQQAGAMHMQVGAEARAGGPGLLPYMRSSSSKPTQDPRPLIVGATAHVTGPPAKTAADILVEEGGDPNRSLRATDETAGYRTQFGEYCTSCKHCALMSFLM